VQYVVSSRETPGLVSCAITEWKRADDVWIPKSMTIRQFEPDGRFIKYTFDYEWEGVNKPVDASYFDHKSFFKDIPDDVRVTDTRDDDE